MSVQASLHQTWSETPGRPTFSCGTHFIAGGMIILKLMGATVNYIFSIFSYILDVFVISDYPGKL